jgi:hypothetical protein
MYTKKRVDQDERLIEFTTNCSSGVNQIDVEIICCEYENVCFSSKNFELNLQFIYLSFFLIYF